MEDNGEASYAAYTCPISSKGYIPLHIITYNLESSHSFLERFPTHFIFPTSAFGQDFLKIVFQQLRELQSPVDEHFYGSASADLLNSHDF